jgi:redox-sensitive bicupin YhaK (pirin superfamily)
MSAGTGVQHSEFNASEREPVHFLQIWIEPNVRGIEPSYEEKRFDEASKRGEWRLIASRDARDGSVLIHQDADVFVTRLQAGETLRRELDPRRRAYVHVVRGEVRVNGVNLASGDALKGERENLIILDEARAAEVLLFDLP